MLLNQLSLSAQEKLRKYYYHYDGNADVNTSQISHQYIDLKRMPNGKAVLPLGAAMEREDLDLMTELLEVGANPQVVVRLYANQNRVEITPKAESIMNLLLRYGAKRDAEVEAFFALKERAKRFIKNALNAKTYNELVENIECHFAGTDTVDDINQEGYSLLHYAAKMGHDVLVKELHRLNVDFMQVDKNKLTPLEIAAEQNKTTTVSLLLSLHSYDKDAIERALLLAKKQETSNAWSTRFWKVCQKLSGRSVSYAGTIAVLEECVADMVRYKV